MNFIQGISKTVMNFRKSIRASAPDILTGVGIGTMITGTALAVSETPTAMKEIEKRKIKEGKDELTPGETFDTCWKCYIPAALAMILGAGCIITGHVQMGRRNAALSMACSIAQTGLQEYKDKVVETIGEKKEKAIRDEIVKDKIEKNPPPPEMVIENPDSAWGQTLFYDVASGRYFHSDLESLKRAANKLNHCMISGFGCGVSLNEWYMEIGEEPIYPLGEDFGWDSNKGLIEIETVEHRRANGTYCTGITFKTPPNYGYLDA